MARPMNTVFGKDSPSASFSRVNHQIRVSPIRLIDQDDNQLV